MTNQLAAHHRAIRKYVIIALTSFISATIICILIRPDLFDHPDYGISFFGSIAKTVPFYTAGLLTTVWGLWHIAKELRPYARANPLRLATLFAAACLVGIVLTPMALAPAVFWTHIGISALLALSQIVAVTWLLVRTQPKVLDFLLAALFYASGIATVLSGTWPGILGVYAWGELGVFISELWLIGRAALRLTTPEALKKV